MTTRNFKLVTKQSHDSSDTSVWPTSANETISEKTGYVYVNQNFLFSFCRTIVTLLKFNWHLNMEDIYYIIIINHIYYILYYILLLFKLRPGFCYYFHGFLSTYWAGVDPETPYYLIQNRFLSPGIDRINSWLWRMVVPLKFPLMLKTK